MKRSLCTWRDFGLLWASWYESWHNTLLSSNAVMINSVMYVCSGQSAYQLAWSWNWVFDRKFIFLSYQSYCLFVAVSDHQQVVPHPPRKFFFVQISPEIVFLGGRYRFTDDHKVPLNYLSISINTFRIQQLKHILQFFPPQIQFIDLKDNTRIAH